VLIHDGPPATRSFTFKAASVIGGTTIATLQLQDQRPGVTNNLGTVAFVFRSPLMNTAAITIPDHGSGIPYPSTISVSGLTGQVTKATATIYGLTHSFPQDISVLLVSPAGGNVLLMSHAGGGYAVTNPITLTFDDSATNALPGSRLLTTGTYQPGSYLGTVAFPAPAPLGPYGSTLAAVNGQDPNGVWSLYVFDDRAGDAGFIAGGWSLVVNPAPAQLSGSISNGEFQLIVAAQPGFTYVIESSTNLTSWLPLSTNTALPDGTIEFTDTSAPSLKERFYRTRQVTP
jgi:subtilisin-like proprotein convertase family protein